MDSDSRGAPQPTHSDIMKRPKKNEWMDNNLPTKSKEGQEEEEEEENERVRRVRVGFKAKRERRQGSSSATMCQVCNIRLNSSAQAQIHYRGKTHQRRLRRLAKAVSAGALSQNQVHPLLGSLPLPGRPLQPQTQLEHFLPLRVNGSSPLSLFPNFNTMDPVQKAVINHTFGMSQPKKKPIISCNICHLRFNSTTQAEAHYKGHKHARKLKAMETQKNRQKNGPGQPCAGKDRDAEAAMMEPIDAQLKDKTDPNASPQPENSQGNSQSASPSSTPSCSDSSSPSSAQQTLQASDGSQLSDLPSDGGDAASGSASDSDPQGSAAAGEEEAGAAGTEAKNNKKPLHCPTCKVTVNSNSQLESHCSGSKHKQMLDGQNNSQSHRRVKVTATPRPKGRMKQRMGSKSRTVVGVTNQAFHCELCQVSVNSETQLKQHTNSRRHKERLAGKPVKAKFTPYNKLHPNAVLATKLALHKQLSKALPAGLLSGPFNPAALCSMTSGPLALRLPPGPTAIIPGPIINPTLFRPAPGPLRATHAPIIFSPY
ncbi:zinc finger protein 385C-like isoform X1 [Poecilia latipinna]|uniref:Zinc finger protein 385C n=2 Tax=Poecilia latipinna TaxID=48699 RepID=A0A3B3UJJ3_9TELE|nr:PREDICTED: zinc finger protein 385C-like isoform X1 [Poecilia latipinna]